MESFDRAARIPSAMPVKLGRHIHYAEPIQIRTTISNRAAAPRRAFVPLV